MIQISILHTIKLSEALMKDFDRRLSEDIGTLLPKHGAFIFFIPSLIGEKRLSLKIEVVSKKGITEQESSELVKLVEHVTKDFIKKYELSDANVAIWISPVSKLLNVSWISRTK